VIGANRSNIVEQNIVLFRLQLEFQLGPASPVRDLLSKYAKVHAEGDASFAKIVIAICFPKQKRDAHRMIYLLERRRKRRVSYRDCFFEGSDFLVEGLQQKYEPVS
jgi:hypothetical protein